MSMTAFELNASLLKELSTIAGDEEMVKDVISYIQRLRRKMEKKARVFQREDMKPVDASVDELQQRARQGIADIAARNVLSQEQMMNRRPNL